MVSHSALPAAREDAARVDSLAGLTATAPRLRKEELRTTALLASALEAFREGRRVPWSPPQPTATQTLYEGQIFRRLTSADRNAIAILAGPRENALALARAGKPDDASASMTIARFLLSVARFSREGHEYARTLHNAAESYLSFRRGDHAQSHARMVAAIEGTERLAGWWGESEFIVCRRVHLAHNLMRVEAAAGASRQAIGRGVRLLEYIAAVQAEGSGAESGGRTGTQLDAQVAELFFNLVVETLAELLVPLAVPDARAVLSSLSLIYEPSVGRSWRGREWLAIRSASLGAHAREFLVAATPFLRAGRGTTPTLWYAVAFDLMQTYWALDPVAAQAGIEEIATELATSPRVPECMRAANVPTRE